MSLPNQCNCATIVVALFAVVSFSSAAAVVESDKGLCGSTLPPGNHRFSFDFGCGINRTYTVHVPPQARQGAPLPMVFVLHGLGGDDRQMQQRTKWDTTADNRGFYVVYASGGLALTFQRSWNGGECCLSSRDDMAFFRVLRQRLLDALCVDVKRVYTWGFSAGGFMSHRLGCEASQYFTAVAGVGGTIGLDCPTAPRPVPVFHYHGVLDLVIAYYGGLFRSVPKLIEQWIEFNECKNEPVEFYNEAGVVGIKFDSCKAPGVEVVLYTDNNRGHTLPAASFDFEERLWAFWSRYSIDEADAIGNDLEAQAWLHQLEAAQLPHANWCAVDSSESKFANTGSFEASEEMERHMHALAAADTKAMQRKD